jgi:antitoxin component YwqK of YwqJK toxin-antitoxin module
MTIGIAVLMIVSGFATFAQEDKKAAEARKDVEKAEKSMKHAKAHLREAKIDSAADYKAFRTSAELKIADNKTQIAKLKSKKSNDTKEVKEKYDDKVLALETKNDDLRKRIETSDNTKTGSWSAFKREFNHDMTELGQAITDIVKDNTQ